MPWRLRRAARRLANRVRPSALILMYHRIATVPTDPHQLCVTPAHFAEQLEILRRHAHPIRLSDLVRALAEGRVPRRAVVITCDDGYADNLVNGKPLLERYDVPATAFVTSGYVGSDHEYWWDELERLVLEAGTLPANLQICVGGRAYEWSLDGAADYGEHAFSQHRGWTVAREDDPTPRQRLYRAAHTLMLRWGERERRVLLDELQRRVGASPSARPSHRTLSPAEVVSLAEGGLIEVGAHSVTHPMLPTLSAAAQRDEIRGSRSYLEELLARPVRWFAYPFGAHAAETAVLVREAGFGGACAVSGTVRRGGDPFRLPRVQVIDCDGGMFARLLHDWFLE